MRHLWIRLLSGPHIQHLSLKPETDPCVKQALNKKNVTFYTRCRRTTAAWQESAALLIMLADLKKGKKNLMKEPSGVYVISCTVTRDSLVSCPGWQSDGPQSLTRMGRVSIVPQIQYPGLHLCCLCVDKTPIETQCRQPGDAETQTSLLIKALMLTKVVITETNYFTQRGNSTFFRNSMIFKT